IAGAAGLAIILVLGLALGVGHGPTRVASNNATPPQTTAPGTHPAMPSLTPAAVTSSQSVTRPQKLLSSPAAKAGRFLFEREPKTYELTVLPWFALDQTHDTDIVRKRVNPNVGWTSRHGQQFARPC